MKFLAGLLIALAAAVVQAADRPNIVYIIADDQSWTDFGFMGNESVYTPNIDKLAAKSARFPNGYLPTSVCRPSLVTLLTGLYPHEHMVHFNHGPPGNSAYNKMTSVEEYVRVRSKEFELIERLKTLPGVLAEKGYRSLQTGKFWEGHWRNGGFTEGMTVFEAPPKSQTYGGVRKLASGDRVAHGNGDWGLQIGRETMQPIWDFVADCKKADVPWLIWYAPYLPHQPHDSPEKYYEIARSMPGVKPHQIPYYAAIAQFDDTVGDLVRFVEEHSDLSNTIFVFVSDNGWTASEKPQKGREVEFEHTKNSKRAPFDEGVRSPILFRWDGVIEPKSYEQLVSSIDIVPTLLAAAGCESIESPGIDLLPAMEGKEELDPDRAVYGEIYPGDASSLGHPEVDIAYRWVRKGNFKLIVPRGENAWGGYVRKTALFNVADDPVESRNLAWNPEYEEVESRLRKLLDEWWNPGDASR